ncbi:tetratricopeptide repeat protein [Nannocystis sp. ILAH1]|uniref:tetratricopeptide repeat protein n=1 Tax=unclassified Nannocystis TaxID=2627009 RepID=UPI002271A31E|nr:MULTISPECIES: tetratricopeptide repeat protein [unclassified Nannocystis]MCY0986503.1 tetratricopeptide repeat protein [Nannocystis sp. ILAH1]MCY1071378.1 tetratricopeptide repeat protein [Nannocystis sp. RBIL2]
MTDSSEESRIALALADISRAYLSQGEFAAAETTLRQCIDANVRLLGTPRHASVAALLDMLAVALVQQGKNEEAEAILRECVAIKVEEHGGPAHEEVAHSLHGLGEALSRQGKFEEATKVFHASLHALHQATGTEWPADAGPTLQALAMTHVQLGQYVQAEEAWHRKVELGERLHGTIANSETLSALGMLAQLCLRRVQRPADALRFSTGAWQAALAGQLWEHVLQIGPVHLACLAGNAQPVEAIEQVVRALIEVIDRFHEGHPLRSHAISELQRLYPGPGAASG